MKKLFLLILSIFVVFLLTACSETQETQKVHIESSSMNINNNDLIVEINPNENKEVPLIEETEVIESKVVEEATIDFDLTDMSATMVYAQVYDLMLDATKYFDKTFKINGNLQKFNDHITNEEVYAIIIKDALGCCEQGIEVKFSEEEKPPQTPTDIVLEGSIQGKLGLGDYMYPVLIVDDYLK